jgi:arabinose-5-phosphate isomerase
MVTRTPTPAQTPAPRDAVASALDVLAVEGEGLRAMAERLSADGEAQNFRNAVALILACRGRVVVSGMGKSGHVARKIAATLASTGTPAFFVHPAEASHGDLGMITADDVFIGLSNSGTSEELLAIVPALKRQGAKLIAMTGHPESPLAAHANVHLHSGVAKEACPLNLAPTASTTAQLALGDALAVALLEARGFGPEDFARSHPGGALGRRLLTRVRDVMRSGDDIPRVPIDATLPQAIYEISRKSLGMTAIVDDANHVAGIFTDGDLRRLLESTLDLTRVRLTDVMTRTPVTIGPDALAAEAAEVMDRTRKSQLLVVENGELVGAVHWLILMSAKVI